MHVEKIYSKCGLCTKGTWSLPLHKYTCIYTCIICKAYQHYDFTVNIFCISFSIRFWRLLNYGTINKLGSMHSLCALYHECICFYIYRSHLCRNLLYRTFYTRRIIWVFLKTYVEWFQAEANYTYGIYTYGPLIIEYRSLQQSQCVFLISIFPSICVEYVEVIIKQRNFLTSFSLFLKKN